MPLVCNGRGRNSNALCCKGGSTRRPRNRRRVNPSDHTVTLLFHISEGAGKPSLGLSERSRDGRLRLALEMRRLL